MVYCVAVREYAQAMASCTSLQLLTRARWLCHHSTVWSHARSKLYLFAHHWQAQLVRQTISAVHRGELASARECPVVPWQRRTREVNAEDDQAIATLSTSICLCVR